MQHRHRTPRTSPPSISSRILPPPSSTLFPYTTLFRSCSNNWEGVSHQKKCTSIPSPVTRPMGQGGWRSLKFRSNSARRGRDGTRSEEHTSELQSPYDLVCRLLLEKKETLARRQEALEP